MSPTAPDDPEPSEATLPAETVGASVATGGRIGRYVVLEALGRGGMGVVIAAYDPDLDRKVAIKLLAGGEGASAATARLVREARAMARLVHPHVLAVHEVGVVDGRAYIAMEFAPGGTLREWCAREQPPWSVVLARCLQAGRGLAAAHAAGLIHRDFKPDNVLLAADGTARVADFGLVSGGDELAIATTDGATSTGASIQAQLTQPGAQLGTPAYMAPEQFLGEAVGAAADQFAFCVTVWTLLHGERPFAGQTSAAIAAAVVAGELVEPTVERGVPAWIRAALRRGLARAPDARWPSMTALLAALANDPAVARRRRRWFAGGLAATAAGGLAIVALARGGGEPDTFCRGGGERLAGTWDPARARVLRDTFVATGRGYAADTAARVTARLDAFAATWADARTEACVATRVRGEQSEAMLELRMQCLDRERVALGALVDVMTVRPDVDVLDHAVDATLALPPVAACADTAALQIAIPLPADPRNRAAIEQVRALLARASALDDVGKFPEGLAIVEATAAAAIALQYPQLTAEALIQRASLEERNGDAAAAEATIEQALLAAAAAHDDHLAAKLTSDLVFTVGYRLGRKQDAASLRHRLEVALRRAGDDRALAARAANSLGLMYTEIGEPTEARAQLERSIALWEAERGPDNAQVATAVNNLGNVYQDIGDFVAAKAYVGRGLAIRERVLGPDHPDTAMSADNLANAHSALGEYAESVRLHERALDVYTRALGPNSFDVALTRSNLAEALFAMGRIADARAESEAALRAWEAAQGPDDPNLRYPLNNLAKALMAEGDLVGARRHVERSLALTEKRWGKGALRTTDSLRVLAQIEGAAGDPDGALARFRVIVGIFDRADSGHHPDLVPVLTGLAETALLRAHPAEAAEAATRAIAIATERNLPAGVRARARFALARARWSTDQAQARALAALARDEYTTAGAPSAAQLAAVEAWLASRGP